MIKLSIKTPSTIFKHFDDVMKHFLAEDKVNKFCSHEEGWASPT